MTVRYRNGEVPAAGTLGGPELALAEQVRKSSDEVAAAMDRYDHREALARIWDLVRKANAYLDERAPWHLARAADQGDLGADQELGTVLHEAFRALQHLALLLRPFIPNAADLIQDALGDSAEAIAVDPARPEDR
ncbi:hypothetical protein ACQ4WX_38680 [Streptomyces lasalocidi]